MKKNIRKDIFTIIAVTVAAFLMALNTKTFVNTGGLYPGGMTGMSILIQRAVKQLAGIMLPFSIINITLNIIPVYIGFRFIGKKFTAFSCVMIPQSHNHPGRASHKHLRRNDKRRCH